MIINKVPGVRDPALGIHRVVWGFLLHTTGGGVTDDARYEVINGSRRVRNTPLRPIDVAIKTYIDSQNGSNGYLWGGPHYVIDHDGQKYQVAPDEIMTAHCGGANRGRYFDGSWIRDCSSPTVTEWCRRWNPKFKHPYQLFPSTSPNHDYIGCEMIPCGDGFGTPRPGFRFTQAQHDSAIDLARSCAQLHQFPQGWMRSNRLVGHEDVDPLNRSDAGGGWDPGWLRSQPYFDFEYVRHQLEVSQ